MKAMIVEKNEKTYTASEMKCGQIAVVTGGHYSGAVILRHWAGFVSLSNPENNWDKKILDLNVTILPPGTKIELETEV